MSDEFKDKACRWLTKKKVGIGSVIIAGVYVLLFSALLIGTTTAKYAESRDLFTDYSLARFNAVILGDLGEDYNQAMHNLENSKIKVFGQDFDGYSLKPGLENKKELEFSISNGLNIPDNIANTDIQYTIKLRTTANIPLQYALKYYEKEILDDGTVVETPHTITGAKSRTVKVTNQQGDALWTEYIFREQITAEREQEKKDDEGNVILGEDGKPETELVSYKTSGNEKSFDLPLNESESGLNLNRYSLIISWPTATSTAQKKTSNDISYMKEVEMLEVYVTVSNKNNPKVTEVTENDPRVSTNVETHMPGLIRLVDGANYPPYPFTPDNYSLTLSAFHEDADVAPATFRLRVDDGIESDFDPDNITLNTVPVRTTYSMKIRMPVTELAIENPAGTVDNFSSAGLAYEVRYYDNETSPVTLQKTPHSRYFLVDLRGECQDEEISVYSDEAALARWKELSEDDRDNMIVYREDTMSVNNSDPYQRVIENRKTIDDKEVIIGNLDEACIVLVHNGNEVSSTYVPGLFAAKYPTYIEVTANYTKGING